MRWLERRVELDQPINIHLTGCPTLRPALHGDLGLLGTKVKNRRRTGSRATTFVGAAETGRPWAGSCSPGWVSQLNPTIERILKTSSGIGEPGKRSNPSPRATTCAGSRRSWGRVLNPLHVPPPRNPATPLVQAGPRPWSTPLIEEQRRLTAVGALHSAIAPTPPHPSNPTIGISFPSTRPGPANNTPSRSTSIAVRDARDA